MSAYGHSIRLATASELRGWGEQTRDCSRGLRCRSGARERRYVVPGGWGSYRGGADAVYRASYRYVTGRAGRCTTRELYLCGPCAEQFAKKHSLALPATAAEVGA